MGFFMILNLQTSATPIPVNNEALYSVGDLLVFEESGALVRVCKTIRRKRHLGLSTSGVTGSRPLPAVMFV
jgi:hypothetical protein